MNQPSCGWVSCAAQAQAQEVTKEHKFQNVVNVMKERKCYKEITTLVASRTATTLSNTLLMLLQHNIEETYRTTHCRPVNIDSFFMFFSSSKVKYPWQIIQHIDRSFNPRKNMEARELILGQASTQCEQTLSSWPHAPIPFVGAQLVERLWWRPQIVHGLELTSLYALNACPGEQRSAWQWESAGSRTWIDTRWPEPRLSR